MFGKKKAKDTTENDEAVQSPSDAQAQDELTDLAAGLTSTAPVEEETQPVVEKHFSDVEAEERAKQTVELQAKYAKMRDDTEEIIAEEHPELAPDKPRAQRDYEEQHERT